MCIRDRDRGSDITVMPMMQYRRDSEGNVTDKLYRATSMVVGSQEAWKKWRSLRVNQNEDEAKKAQKEYDAFMSIYTKNTELTVQRKLCILSW